MDGERARGTLDVEEGWDQLGIDHNRGLSYAYERFVKAGLDTTWTFERALDSARVYTLDFIKDSTEYDYEYASMALEGEIELEPSLEEALSGLEALVDSAVISQQEADYVGKLYALVFDGSDWPDSVFADSLNKFVETVHVIDWKEDEIFCLAITDIASHSLVYWSENEWGESEVNQVGKYVAADAIWACIALGGYVRSGAWMWGGWIGGVAATVAGAIVGSVLPYLAAHCN